MMLTDDIRAFLRNYPPTGLLWDVCRELREQFGLTPDDCGIVLAQWIKETC